MALASIEQDGFTVTSNVESEAQLREAFAPDVHVETTEKPDVAEPVADDEADVDDAKPEAKVEAQTDRNPDGTFKPKAKAKDDPQARIDKITWEREEAKRDAAAARAELAALKVPKSAPVAETKSPEAVSEPDEILSEEAYFAKFPDKPYSAYTRYVAAEETKAALAARDKSDTEKRRDESATALIRAHEARVAASREKYPTWNQDIDTANAALVAANVQMPKAFLDAILGSDRSVDIVHDLSTHPEVCIQLIRENANLHDSAAPLMRRLLEARLTTAQPGPVVLAKPISTAKPPIQPVGTSPSATDDDDRELSIEDHIRRENARDKTRRR